MRIAAVYSISPLSLEFEKKNIGVYERNELDRLFRELVARGFLTSAYTLYSQALRSLRTGDIVSTRAILRKMRSLLENRRVKSEGRKVENSKEDEITLVDESNDTNVSFKSPASVPSFASELFIIAHEGEHARRILREALLKGEKVNVLIRIFYRYDSKGRIIAVGGATTAEIYRLFENRVFEAVA